jgi:hypothetical protein
VLLRGSSELGARHDYRRTVPVFRVADELKLEVRRLGLEAANVMLTRYKCQLKKPGLGLSLETRVALARRLAMVMHAMLRDGTEFASA